MHELMVTDGFRRTKESCRQRRKLRIPNYSRRTVKFSNKVQNSGRRPLISAGNRESYKH